MYFVDNNISCQHCTNTELLLLSHFMNFAITAGNYLKTDVQLSAVCLYYVSFEMIRLMIMVMTTGFCSFAYLFVLKGKMIAAF